MWMCERYSRWRQRQALCTYLGRRHWSVYRTTTSPSLSTSRSLITLNDIIIIMMMMMAGGSLSHCLHAGCQSPTSAFTCSALKQTTTPPQPINVWHFHTHKANSSGGDLSCLLACLICHKSWWGSRPPLSLLQSFFLPFPLCRLSRGSGQSPLTRCQTF